jgi:hypothetical protein
MLMEAVERAEAGITAGIVVAKLDRFGRSLRHGLIAIERITKAGGTLVSVDDGFDFGTDTGRLVLKIMLSMAEWELDRIRANWAVARQKAAERGVHIGPIPVGYKRGADGRLEPDPVLGPAVTWLFEQRADGLPIKQLADALSAKQIPTACGGKAWGPTTVRRVLQRRIYLGELRLGTYVNQGAHASLTDAATWTRAQRPDGRPSVAAWGAPRVLRGTVRCASCGRTMHSTGATYVCSRRSAAGLCPRPVTVLAARVEPHAEAIFWQLLEHQRAPRRGRITRTEHQVAVLEAQLTEYRDNAALQRTLGPDRFAAGIKVRAERLDLALLDLAQAQREASTEPPLATELRQRWGEMSTDAKAATLRTMLDCVFVRPGQGSPRERLVVFARGRAPSGLIPYGEQRTPALRPLREAEVRQATRLGSGFGRPWVDTRLRGELKTFLADRTEWPTYADFQLAGQALLYRQVELQGGAERWAVELDLSLPTKRDPLKGWTEDRIRRELDAFLPGRETWPTYSEFKAAGLHNARLALGRMGGVEQWAAAYGLVVARKSRSREPWDDERIATEREPLLKGRIRWPPRSVFESASLRSLYNALSRRGDHEAWAVRFAVRPPPARNRTPKVWTEDKILHELTELIERHGRWPRFTDFRNAGLTSLYNRLKKDETVSAWAERCGVQANPPYQVADPALSRACSPSQSICASP